jgi:hypothetical protein
MVMGYEHITDGTKAEAIVRELLLQCSESYSYIYYEAIRFGEQVVAVTAAAAPKGYKS